ncbi:hypothetical protein C8R43DRAFT_1104075 [Mycena crocata]|nr:hypothetical protein C8R43DRAFT_1104075 [Mycena crocata]
MQFTLTKLFALVAAAQSIGLVTAAPTANTAGGTAADGGDAGVTSFAAAADINVGILCPNSNLSGSCASINVNAVNSVCFNVLPQFDNQITSLRVNAGERCIFYQNAGCTGASRSFTGTTLNLAGDALDNSISAYQCFRI